MCSHSALCPLFPKLRTLLSLFPGQAHEACKDRKSFLGVAPASKGEERGKAEENLRDSVVASSTQVSRLGPHTFNLISASLYYTAEQLVSAIWREGQASRDCERQ